MIEHSLTEGNSPTGECSGSVARPQDARWLMVRLASEARGYSSRPASPIQRMLYALFKSRRNLSRQNP